MANKKKAAAQSKAKVPQAPAAEGTTRVVRIKSSQEGFWRAGVKHSKETVDHPIERFSDAQLQQLAEEPKLSVEFVDVPKADAKPEE